MDMDADLKRSILNSDPDMRGCIDILVKLDLLPISKLMLKKQPDIVCTMDKLRRYVGPSGCDDAQKNLAKMIRIKADRIALRVKAAFKIPEKENLWPKFKPFVIQFREAVKGMERKKILAMVTDPTT